MHVYNHNLYSLHHYTLCNVLFTFNLVHLRFIFKRVVLVSLVKGYAECISIIFL